MTLDFMHQMSYDQAEEEEGGPDSVDSSENSPSVLGSPPRDMSFDSTDLPLYDRVST